MAKKILIPGITIGMGISQGMRDIVNPTKSGAQFYNKAARTTSEEVLKEHHKKHIPKHFKATNRHEYDHKRRTKKWKSMKKRMYRSVTDLVAKGELKTSITGPPKKYQYSGNYMAGTFKATMYMKIPWPVADDPSHHPSAVTVADMKREIRKTTDSEAKHLGTIWEKHFANQLNRHRVMARNKRMWRAAKKK